MENMIIMHKIFLRLLTITNKALELEPDIVENTPDIGHRFVLLEADIAYIFYQPISIDELRQIDTKDEKKHRKEYLSKYKCQVDNLTYSDYK